MERNKQFNCQEIQYLQYVLRINPVEPGGLNTLRPTFKDIFYLVDNFR